MSAPEPLSAHALLIEQHAFLRRLARSLVADPERADDLAQDVAVLALRHPPRQGSSPRAWLARVLRNRAVSLARSESRRRDREANVPEPAPQPTPPELEARLRVQRAVIEAVARLEEPYRSVVLLRYDQDLAPTAIAARLGVPVATVKTRLARALERLRRDLDARNEPGTPAWSVVLLAGLDPLRPSAATAAVAAGGAIMGVKLAAMVAAVTVAGVWGALWMAQAPTAVVETASSPAAAAVAVGPEGVLAADGVEPRSSDSNRTALAMPLTAAPVPNWALHLSLNGITGSSAGTAHVTVHDGHAEKPASELELELRPSWTIDLGPLFEDDAKSPGSVRVWVDHPEYLPAEISVLVPGAWKAESFPGGRLEAELTLREPKAIVTGEVRLEEEPQSVALGAAIFAMRRDHPVEEPVERVTLDANRRYRMRADHAEEHVVVAYVAGSNGVRGRRETDPARGGALRPASRVVVLPTIGQEELELDPLVLEVGETVSGRMENGTDVELFVACSIAQRGARARRQIVWLGDRFENGPTAFDLEQDSTFHLHGLAPLEYELSPAPRWRASSDDPDSLFRFWSAQDSEVRTLAPARDVIVRFDWTEVVFEVHGGGTLLPYATLEFIIDDIPEREGFTARSHGTDTGPSGRLRVQCNPRHAMRVRISDPRYDTKEFHYDASELRSGSEFVLAFDGPSTPTPTMIVSYTGDLGLLGRPDGIGFTAFECGSRPESEIHEALATPFLAGFGPPWGYEGAIHLARVQWDTQRGTWSSDELRPGRYVVAAHRRTHHAGEHSDVVGGAFVVDLAQGATVHVTWAGALGGSARFNIAKSAVDGPDMVSAWLVDAEGESVPVLLEEIGGGVRSGDVDGPGNYAVVGALPVGEYSLQVNLRGGGERLVAFRVDAGATTDVRIDLSRL